jgi:hypothetical protein
MKATGNRKHLPVDNLSVSNVLQQCCVMSETSGCSAVLSVGRYAVTVVRRDAASNCSLFATEDHRMWFA